jgi:predicted transcriptional regulator
MPTKEFALKKLRDETGDSVIVSFSARWAVPMQQNGFSVVYRKHRPAKMETHWMYAYCSRPVSAIVARMPVKSVTDMSIDEAIALSDRSMHSRQEILNYTKSAFRDYTSLVVYEIGAIEYSACPIPLRLLIEKYDYWPSSSFIPISDEGKRILDKLGQFGGKARTSHQSLSKKATT